jgi:hypothetical protein
MFIGDIRPPTRTMLVPLLMLIGVLDAAAEPDTCAVADSPSKFKHHFVTLKSTAVGVN